MTGTPDTTGAPERSASSRLTRRLLVPFAVVVTAAALGTFVIGRDHVDASSSLMQNPGMSLAGSTNQTTSQEVAEGRVLFTENCSSCHGVNAQGGSLGPDLQGRGGATVDLWLRAGWMPLRNPEAQPEAKPIQLTNQQINDIVAYVVSLKKGGIAVPAVSLKGANAAEGFAVFSLNCAPCHTITGAGDALADGYHAPALRNNNISATMVLEAIRTGPQNMPNFGPNNISNQDALDIVLYVTKYIQHPRNPGGIGLGGVGPVAEGFVGLFVGVGLCLLAAYWVGDRTAKEEGHEGNPEDEHHAGEDDPEGAYTDTHDA